MYFNLFSGVKISIFQVFSEIFAISFQEASFRVSHQVKSQVFNSNSHLSFVETVTFPSVSQSFVKFHHLNL